MPIEPSGLVHTGEGYVSPAGLIKPVERLYEQGLPPGDFAGWHSLKPHYSVPEGFVTVVTGWPGSGKSEFVDAITTNLVMAGWHGAYYSPENQPLELHQAKLLEKYIGKPFGDGPTERMSAEEIREVLLFGLGSKITFVQVPEDEALTAQKVIEVAWKWLQKFPKSKRFLVIDPWNELDHWRPRELSETEHISRTLQFVRSWARRTGVHVFIVAHPQKMPRNRDSGKLPIPTLDMIAGSQHWWNKADFGLCVYRDPSDHDTREVEIHSQKVRFKHHGVPGLTILKYDRVTGRYSDNIVGWNETRHVNKKLNKGASA